MSTKLATIGLHGPVIGYLRVSTQEQAASGLGLAAQRSAIEAYAARIGIQVERWATDEAVSGSVHPVRRPALSEALSALASTRGGFLLVAKSDRIARKASDLLTLVDRAESERWTLAATDGSLDTSSPAGKMLVTVMAGVAELERSLIAQRTREALAAKRAAGVRLGRPILLPEPVRQRIRAERNAGRTMQQIADDLNRDRVPTASGRAHWYSASVANVLRSLDHDMPIA